MAEDPGNRRGTHFAAAALTLCRRALHERDRFIDVKGFRQVFERAAAVGGDRVVEIIGRYAPNVPGAVVGRDVITPLDLERRFGITEGNIFHGDIRLDQLFFMRPLPGWAHYRTPIDGLYLCGAGTHPGGGVTGAPGYNAARAILRRPLERL